MTAPKSWVVSVLCIVLLCVQLGLWSVKGTEWLNRKILKDLASAAVATASKDAEPSGLAPQILLCDETFKDIGWKGIKRLKANLGKAGVRKICSADDLEECPRDGTQYAFVCLRVGWTTPILARSEILQSYGHVGGDQGFSVAYLFIFGRWVRVWEGDAWVT